MKRLLAPFVLVLALALNACAPAQKVVDFVTVATQTVANPLDEVDIYRVKNVYAAGLELADAYRDYCWKRPYAVLMADPIARPFCQNRRAMVRTMQATALRASNAIRVADDFIRANPTGNAVSYVRAAWTAVQDFRAAIPAVKN